MLHFISVVTAVWTQKLGTVLPKYIAEAGLKAGLRKTSLPLFVVGIASRNMTLAASAPGVTIAALDAYPYALKYIWIVGPSHLFPSFRR